MLIDFQSKFNNFNDVRFSDQVSGCDFEFSSVLRRWWKGWGKNGEDMEGVWSVQQITLYWTSANIYHHRRSLFFDILKFSIGFPTNCWQILNWRQFQSVLPLFFTFTIFHLWFLLTKNSLLQIKDAFDKGASANDIHFVWPYLHHHIRFSSISKAVFDKQQYHFPKPTYLQS